MKSETLTLVLVNLAGIMERADVSVLPSMYKEVGAALHVDPTGLGSLTLYRSIVQLSCYPLATYLASRHNRTHVISLGVFLWAAATFLVAVSSTYFQVAVSRGLSGVGLAIVIPAIQSLIADSTDDSNRGMAFGWLHLTANIGSILGGLCSILIASTSFLGIPGWRIAFHLVGLISVIVGILVRLFARDPRYNGNRVGGKEETSTATHHNKSFWTGFGYDMKDLFKEAKSVIKIPSFQVIVAQGVPGSFPRSALDFAPMWLELIGFSHKTTAILMALFAVAGSIGGLFGGWMGDTLARILPNAGRIILSQISSGSGIPLAAVLLLALTDDPSTAFSHGLVFVVFGLCTSWDAPATNNPIFAEIVPERARTTIYALDRLFESIFSSFAPLIVGLLAQKVYGYKPIPKGLLNSNKIETDRENAASLAKALYTAIGIPMAISCSIYSFLYCTYPRDRERAKVQMLVESEMQRLADGDDEESIEIEVEDLDLGDHDDDEKSLLRKHER